MADREERERERRSGDEAQGTDRDELGERGIDQAGAGMNAVEGDVIARRDETFDPEGETTHGDGGVEYLRRRQGSAGGDSGMRE